MSGLEPADPKRWVECDRELAALGEEAAMWRLGLCRRLARQIQATADELNALTAYCDMMGLPLDEP